MFTTSIFSFDIGILALLFDLQQPISQVGKKGKDSYIYQDVHYPHCQIRMCLGAFEIRIKSIIFYIVHLQSLCQIWSKRTGFATLVLCKLCTSSLRK